MSFTYNPNLTADVHKIRFRLQDTDAAKAKAQDEEYTAVLAYVGSTGWTAALRAGAVIARSFHVRYGSTASVSALGTSIAYRDRAWLDLAEELEKEADGLASGVVVLPYIGGIGTFADTTIPWAYLGIHDNPLAPMPPRGA